MSVYKKNMKLDKHITILFKKMFVCIIVKLSDKSKDMFCLIYLVLELFFQDKMTYLFLPKISGTKD